MAVDLGWLGYVPGARAAYDWLTSRMQTYFGVGQALSAQVADLDRFWYSLPRPPYSASQSALLNQWVQIRNEAWNKLEEWRRYEPWARKVWNAVQRLNNGERVDEAPPVSPQLGVDPISGTTALLIVVGVATAAVTLYNIARPLVEWFTSHQRTIDKFYRDAVAQGLISPVDAAKALQTIDLENTAAGGGLNTMDVLLYGGAALLALLVLSPGRRR